MFGYFNSLTTDLKVYYIGPLIINSQAHVSNSVIVIDIGLDFRYSAMRIGIVGAHELHHLLLGKWELKRSMGSMKYFVFIQVLRSLMVEGIADLVDKKFMNQEDTFFCSLISERFSMSDSLICELNLELENLNKAPEGRPEFMPIIKLIGNGHDPGRYMALVIERNGYLPELLNNIHNPFAFFYIYNKAAKKDKLRLPTFSSSAISYLKVIEQLSSQ